MVELMFWTTVFEIMHIDTRPRRTRISVACCTPKTPDRYVHSVSLKESLAWRDEHALFLSVVSPSARPCLTAVLLGISFDPLLELRSEVSY